MKNRLGLSKFGSQYISEIRDAVDELIRESGISRNSKIATLLNRIDKEVDERERRRK